LGILCIFLLIFGLNCIFPGKKISIVFNSSIYFLCVCFYLHCVISICIALILFFNFYFFYFYFCFSLSLNLFLFFLFFVSEKLFLFFLISIVFPGEEIACFLVSSLFPFCFLCFFNFSSFFSGEIYFCSRDVNFYFFYFLFSLRWKYFFLSKNISLFLSCIVILDSNNFNFSVTIFIIFYLNIKILKNLYKRFTDLHGLEKSQYENHVLLQKNETIVRFFTTFDKISHYRKILQSKCYSTSPLN